MGYEGVDIFWGIGIFYHTVFRRGVSRDEFFKAFSKLFEPVTAFTQFVHLFLWICSEVEEQFVFNGACEVEGLYLVLEYGIAQGGLDAEVLFALFWVEPASGLDEFVVVFDNSV